MDIFKEYLEEKIYDVRENLDLMVNKSDIEKQYQFIKQLEKMLENNF